MEEHICQQWSPAPNYVFPPVLLLSLVPQLRDGSMLGPCLPNCRHQKIFSILDVAQAFGRPRQHQGGVAHNNLAQNTCLLGDNFHVLCMVPFLHVSIITQDMQEARELTSAQVSTKR